MTTTILSRRLLVTTSVFAITAALLTMPAAPAAADTYMAGDFHNHTTCTDGTVSIETMITKSIQTFGLEWLASADHGGNGVRDCRFDDPEGDGSVSGSGKFWVDADSIGVAALKGDAATSGGRRVMWRWQNIEEFVFPEVARMSNQLQNPLIFAGLETNAPGHEHVSMAALGAQRAYNYSGDIGNASATAEFEYRFDRSDTDMSGKGGTPGTPNSGIWKGKVANASGPGLGTANHINKAVPSVAWLQANFPLDSYYIPAHLERAGVFDPNGNRGFNVEHLRDFNNAGPTVAVGFETMPGHQASATRGEYRKDFGGPGIDSAGVTTYGGTGIYGAKIGGMWDALLGEGRNWFFYASSDWHNRGAFDPYSRQSTQDFYPGEYQRLYIPRPAAGTTLRPQHIFDAVRAGNSFSVSGDLITKEFTYTAEVVGLPSIRAKMGETLVVPRGRQVLVTLEVNLPTTPNNSPYSFNNPSLMQLNIQEPLNRPTLRQVDFIRGNITGVIPANSANYTNPTNPSASIIANFSSANWIASGQKRTMKFLIPSVQANQYVRVRGTNLPPGTTNETDPQGNPLTDPVPADAKIPCLDAACPAHMGVVGGTKMSTYDVAAWADLWFYANPIFIRVSDQPKLLVETNADKAATLKQALAR